MTISRAVLGVRARSSGRRSSVGMVLLASLMMALVGASAAPAKKPASAARPVAAGAAERQSFRVVYTAWLEPGDPMATVRIRLASHPEWVPWMRLRIDPARYRDFKGTGKIRTAGDQVHWTPPRRDAWLQYKVNLESQRDIGRYDGRVTESWALFRADDLVPAVHLGMEDRTQSKAKLKLELPKGWSAATAYPRYASGRFKIDNPQRLFDRPTGWILVGKLGVLREKIGATRLAIAAPTGQGARRLDTLAFFRFTLPTLQAIFPDFPERLLVASAGDPMWRGALSGPSSLFVHADRPLISGNGTSTFIHELVHVAMRARSGAGADWIVEGLAEYYSLEVLRRSGAISQSRSAKAHARLAEWAKQADSLAGVRSQGAVTARAVGVMRSLDAEIRRLRGGKAGLDDVVRLLSRGEAVTTETFRAAAEKIAGGPLSAFPKP